MGWVGPSRSAAYAKPWLLARHSTNEEVLRSNSAGLMLMSDNLRLLKQGMHFKYKLSQHFYIVTRVQLPRGRRPISIWVNWQMKMEGYHIIIVILLNRKNTSLGSIYSIILLYRSSGDHDEHFDISKFRYNRSSSVLTLCPAGLQIELWYKRNFDISEFDIAGLCCITINDGPTSGRKKSNCNFPEWRPTQSITRAFIPPG